MNYYYNLKHFFIDIENNFSDNIALRYPTINYTYRDLRNVSNKILEYLKSLNLKSGDIIAIASTKTFEDFALMIACLKAGIVYTNFDVDNPIHRLKSIFNTCKPKIVFTAKDFKKIQLTCNEFNIKYLLYSQIPKTHSINGTSRDNDFDGDSIAYVMFTSGSTGEPKGVAISHQSIMHFINWTTTRYEINESDNFANISPMYFDNSVFDFYSALFNGASITPITKELLTKPLELVNYIDQKKCTIWFSVPSMLIYLLTMKVLSKETLRYIRIFTFGGEGFPKTELKKLYDLYSNNSNFINVYGPTEGTCICSSYKITDKDFDNLDELPSLGMINPNFSYIILDNNNNRSAKGELYILGPNISKGYYNNIEQTEKVFNLYTDENHYNKRMYKTGDIVEEIDGLLYFLGRKDNQIKHMGYRIELEEIENALNSIEEINQTAVIYRKSGTEFGKIIACISLNNKIEKSDLKNRLLKIIPSYMLPHKIIIMDTLPKNQNGKIDKIKLIDTIS